jgi:hypothetical protein
MVQQPDPSGRVDRRGLRRQPCPASGRPLTGALRKGKEGVRATAEARQDRVAPPGVRGPGSGRHGRSAGGSDIVTRQSDVGDAVSVFFEEVARCRARGDDHVDLTLPQQSGIPVDFHGFRYLPEAQRRYEVIDGGFFVNRVQLNIFDARRSHE